MLLASATADVPLGEDGVATTEVAPAQFASVEDVE
jgi:hypothetical protein